MVVSLDHRLAPEDPYPAALEDAMDALNWIFENGSEELKVNSLKVAVGGCSRCDLPDIPMRSHKFPSVEEISLQYSRSKQQQQTPRYRSFYSS